jgi:hypothetical protein
MALTPEELRRQGLDTAAVVEDTLRNIASQIGDIFEQAFATSSTVAQATAQELESSLKKFAKVSDDVASNVYKIQQGLLKSKTIQDQINQRKSTEEALGIKLITNLKMQGAVGLSTIDDLIKKNQQGIIGVTNAYNNLDPVLQNIVDQYVEVLRYNEAYINDLNEQNKTVKLQEEKLGNTGKLLKGISKIPVLGNLIDAEKVLRAAQVESAKVGASRLSVMGASFKALGKSLKTGLTDPLTIATFLIKSIVNVDNKIVGIQKSFGVTRSTARGLAASIEQTAASTNDIFISGKKLNESFRELSSTLGFVADISGQTLETFTNLTKRLGFSNEEAARLTYLSRLQSENTEDVLQSASKTVSALNRQKGTAINIKAVFGDIANASAATTVSLGGSVEALAEAATKARQLGLTLAEVDQVASSLLDFQTSIENELAAELLTGKQINLEAARYYALVNDTAKLTEEIGNNQELINAFATDNRLAQEAAAKALGLSREELGKMVMKTQLLALGAEGFKAKFGEANYEQMQALSIGEKFQSALEKIQELIGNIVFAFDPVIQVLGKAVELVGTFLGYVNKIGSTFGGITGVVIGLIPVLLKASTIASAFALNGLRAGIAAIFTSFAEIPFGIGIPLAVAAAAGLVTMFKGDDMVSTGYGKRMLYDKGAIIALNDKDNLVATTNNINPNPVKINNNQINTRTRTSTPPTQTVASQPTPTQQTLNNKVAVEVNYNGRRLSNLEKTNQNKIGSGLFNGIDMSVRG